MCSDRSPRFFMSFIFFSHRARIINVNAPCHRKNRRLRESSYKPWKLKSQFAARCIIAVAFFNSPFSTWCFFFPFSRYIRPRCRVSFSANGFYRRRVRYAFFLALFSMCMPSYFLLGVFFCVVFFPSLVSSMTTDRNHGRYALVRFEAK